MGHEGPYEDEKLTDEPVQARQADGGQHDHREHASHDRGGPLQTSQFVDEAGMATLVDHPDQQEQGAGGDAVVDHLEQAAFDALRVEGEGTQDDEPQMGHRGVGHQSLEVPLHGGDHGAVEDPHHPKGHEQRGGEVGGLGKQVQTEPQEAVGPEL